MPDKIKNRSIINPNASQSSSCIETFPVILINETNDTLYVAEIEGAKKSDYFRNLSFGKMIEVIGINRKNILNIIYQKNISRPLSHPKPM
jgi:hypothetical protein